jgi:L-asparaginase
MNLERDKICVVSTGGTFDKSYDASSESMTFLEPSCIPRILGDCLVGDFSFNQIMQIDSLRMDDGIRTEIVGLIQKADFKRFVIVHGTSRMTETGKFLQQLPSIGTVVLTGAMVPYRYDATEAAFNLGGAIALARYLPSGVYMYMHGRVFDPSHTDKDESVPRFVETS